MFRDFKPKIKLFLLVALVAVIISVVGILLLRTMQSTPSPTPQVLDTSGWQTYRNDEFGFEITFGGNWNGYKPVTARDVDGDAIIFCLPINDKNYADSLCDGDGFALVFHVGIYTKSQWSQIPKALQGPIIGQRGDMIFSYDKEQDNPDDLLQQYNEVEQILSTFRFVE